VITHPAAADAVTLHGCDHDATELSVLLSIVTAMRPALIVEIGCDTGGSLYAWAATGADLIGVSLGPHDPREQCDPHGAVMITGNSHAEVTMQMLEKELDGRRPDFLMIDGDHSEAGCRSDWRLAQRVGAHAVGFHDLSPRRIPGDPGVRKVWAEACARYPSVTIRNPADVNTPGAGIVWLDAPLPLSLPFCPECKAGIKGHEDDPLWHHPGCSMPGG
jgi:hypothetical protein